MRAPVILQSDWREPASILASLAHEDYSVGLISDGSVERGRWSYVAARPDEILSVDADEGVDPFSALSTLIGSGLGMGPAIDPDLPPFQGGVIGLASYELGARSEPVNLARSQGWPDLVCARYSSLLAFDHLHRKLFAIGCGSNGLEAADIALSWLTLPRPPVFQGQLAQGFEAAASNADYEANVATVVKKIEVGEIFQANIAQSWWGRLRSGATPADLIERLIATSPAPFAGYVKLPGRAVVSNSPERFIRIQAGTPRLAQTRPIKGTSPRGGDPQADQAMAQNLRASIKDRAENLMIVDLMRNDLARVCMPGTVRTPELFEVETFTNVHHLVSTVVGELIEGVDAGDVLRATYPPGSISGAPKVQAMRVISQLEPPRGPYCGVLFWAGFDGGFDSSVLIRTVALVQDADGWSFDVRAGAGIVADSDPASERLETEHKISAIRAALSGSER
jgi:para-aminobenzoate synthetase component 1